MLLFSDNFSDFQVFLFTENLTTTIADVDTQIRKSEYERLKLSAAVSSLEAFRLNMTKSSCGRFYFN